MGCEGCNALRRITELENAIQFFVGQMKAEIESLREYRKKLWITDGTTEKKWMEDTPLPKGYVWGRASRHKEKADE